jgi:hypothetical protein
MTRTDSTASLTRLRILDGSVEEQAALAVRLVEQERNVDVVIAALDVLGKRADPAVRPALLRRYAYYDRDGSRRDPAGTIRIAILRVLRPLAMPDDAALFERAASTYEYLYGEAAGGLRAAGLLALSEVDATRAGFHAVRLLTDEHTSTMSGEPALTAARLLAAGEQLLPLYAYVLREGPAVSDVTAEALRSLTALPAALLPALADRFRESDDEIVLLGLFDLLLAHPARAEFQRFIVEFLHATRLYAIHRYLASAIVAARDMALIAELTTMEKVERDPRKRDALRQALALR